MDLIEKYLKKHQIKYERRIFAGQDFIKYFGPDFEGYVYSKGLDVDLTINFIRKKFNIYDQLNLFGDYK